MQSNSKKKILFISHDASRTGAPILLLHFIRGIKDSKWANIEIEILLGADGPLKEEFAALGKTTCLQIDKQKTVLQRILNKFIKSSSLEEQQLTKINKQINGKYWFIFSNTIVNGTILKSLNRKAGYVFTYVHELPFSINNYFNKNVIQNTIEFTNHIFVPSTFVASQLHKNNKVSLDKMSVLRYFIPSNFEEVMSENIKNDESNFFTIGSVGSACWRKGFDMFLLLPQFIHESMPNKNFKFLWVGIDKNSIEYKMAIHDLEKANLLDKFIFVDPVSDVENYLKKMDVFVLLSREDPYPLVILEAAKAKKPIICFDKSGGISEFVGDDCGIKVSYMDLFGVAESIRLLLENNEMKLSIVNNAYKRVIDWHNYDNTVKTLIKLVEEKLDI